MHVRAKCKRAVLHVERKTEDLQVAGGDETQHPVPANVTCVVDINVWTGLGDIVVHAWRVHGSGYKRMTRNKERTSKN